MSKVSSSAFMPLQRIAKQGVTHPFGDARTVKQAFPSAIPTHESDPFLMCDYFDSVEKNGPVADPDSFPVDWHPHRGFDICTYLKSGIGRHGDSLGNRETFETPGMQWMSTGSGVVHAEGGANLKGTRVQGFQIWINVPSHQKMEPPRYGTVPTSDLPLVQEAGPGVSARILAGEAFDKTGPFATTQPVQMVDFELQPNSQMSLNVPSDLDTTMVYVYEGVLASLNNEKPIQAGHIALMDATLQENRTIQFQTESLTAKVLLFAGKKLGQPVAWHGPIVMNTQQQVQATIRELRAGTFPPVRVDWDYKRIDQKPSQ